MNMYCLRMVGKISAVIVLLILLNRSAGNDKKTTEGKEIKEGVSTITTTTIILEATGTKSKVVSTTATSTTLPTSAISWPATLKGDSSKTLQREETMLKTEVTAAVTETNQTTPMASPTLSTSTIFWPTTHKDELSTTSHREETSSGAKTVATTLSITTDKILPVNFTVNHFGETYIFFKWSTPEKTGTKLNIRYTLSWSNPKRTLENKTTEEFYNLTGLTPGQLYTINISSEIIDGDGQGLDPVPGKFPLIQRTRPAMIQNISANATASNVTITFAVANGIVEKYTIILHHGEQIGNKTITNSSSSVVFTDLLPEAQYNVSFFTVTGNSSSKEFIFQFVTKAAASGPVTSVNISSVTNTSFMITWKQPDKPNGKILAYIIDIDTGSKPATGIILQCFGNNPEENKSVLPVASACCLPLKPLECHEPTRIENLQCDPAGNLQHTFSNLTAFTTYTVTVYPYNKAGCGKSETRNITTCTGVSSPVTSFNITSVSSKSFLISWKPPSNPNGIILAYVIDITTGKNHVRRISLKCEEHNATMITESHNNTQEENIKCVQQEYFNYNVSNLIAFTSYIVSLSPYSEALFGERITRNITTSIAVPCTPTNFRVNCTNDSSVTLRWETQPEKPGPTNYTVIVCQETERHSGSFEMMKNTTIEGFKTSGTTISGLTSWWNYTFTVMAVTVAGHSPLTETLSVRTAAAIPVTPTEFNVTAVNATSITLSWRPLSLDPGPMNYTVHVCEERKRKSNSFTSLNPITIFGLKSSRATVNELVSFWTYRVSLSASTVAGQSEPTAYLQVTTSSSKPGFVQDINITAITNNYTHAHVAWRCPKERDMHGSILRYKLVYISVCETDRYPTQNAKCHVITPRKESSCFQATEVSVVAECNYTFQISAWNDEGYGPQLNRSYSALPGPSGPVASFNITNITGSKFTAHWTPPLDPNGIILGYAIVVKRNNSCVQEISLTATYYNRGKSIDNLTSCKSSEHKWNGDKYTVWNLTAATDYAVTITPFNACKFGKATTSTVRTAVEVPRISVHYQIQVLNSSSINLTWIQPKRYPGPTNYTVAVLEAESLLSKEYTVMQIHIIEGFSTTTCLVAGLLSSWRYKFRLMVSTSAGNSSFVTKIVQTKESAPGMVQKLIILPINRNFTAVNVTWTCPNEKERNGNITTYKLLYFVEKERNEVIQNKKGIQFPAGSDVCQNQEIVPVTPEFNYTFMIVPINHFTGVKPQGASFYTKPGQPPRDNIDRFVSTPGKMGKGTSEDSFTVSVCNSCLTDATNGKIIMTGLVVCKENSCKRVGNSVEDFKNIPTWYQWKQDGYRGVYRPTSISWLNETYSDKRQTRSTDKTMFYDIGKEAECESSKTEYCNGPVESGSSYKVQAFSCTNGGCSKSEFIGPINTEAKKSDVVVIVAGVVGGTLPALVIIVVIIVYLLWRRNHKDEDDDSDSEDAESEIDQTRPIKIYEFSKRLAEMHKDSDIHFSIEFAEVKTQSPDKSSDTAMLDCNKIKNRYTNILAFDETRVKLLPIDEDENTDYINANYIPGYSSPREYIATQGPMEITVPDFWRMVWEQKVPRIVMLSGLMEKGRIKVNRYWPQGVNEPVQYGDIFVEKTNDSTLNKYNIMIFKLSVGTNERTVKHFFLPGWEDYNANLTSDDVMGFVQDIRAEKRPTDIGPIVVHCSAGVGRTGTFIALDYFMQMIRDHDMHYIIDIFNFVLRMRQNRPLMVQSETQYMFIHDTINDMIKKKIASLDENEEEEEENVYANQAFEECVYMNVAVRSSANGKTSFS